jgi:PKD repeat protein
MIILYHGRIKIMSRESRVIYYIRCDVCGETDEDGNTSFDHDSDWNENHGFNVCDQCSEDGENGEIWDYRSIEEVITDEIPDRENSTNAFMKADAEGEIKFVKWI